MSQPRALVLRAAGTNCERETAWTLEQAGAEAEILHVNELLRDPDRLLLFHLLAIPGGFSYGDDLGSGVVFANQLRTRLKTQIEKFIESGKLMLGICNGFQVLLRAGLLTGRDVFDDPTRATLAWNMSGRYEDRWVDLRIVSEKTPFVSGRKVVSYPVAHAEGRFVAPDDVLDELEQDQQVVFQYVDRSGRPTQEYPANPNGASRGIAGICSKTGQVLGLMPHPERNIRPFHHPDWKRMPKREHGDGFELFQNAVRRAGQLVS
ncbi:MAG: phosphoribosylformylglycinamidine synthase I [Planctomycetes bacterium]|nr:phosphoribosylformylglycinamidine synthase I [Planctomycetota bacterium]MCA8936856.1 phosphoribosylformylglycinamidine synthase I [Planctomycetota bacterium]